MAEPPALRVVDAGAVSALRSQSLYHGLAAAMTPESEPTLSLCRPREPYLCIGYHRSLDEVDMGRCADLGLPVLRRRIGGGPVYIDSDQLFFQLTLPAGAAPASIERLYAFALGPAVAAFRSLGLDAGLRGGNDVAVEGRRLSGTGAGRIGGGVTVVGNVIFRFPHRRMADLLVLPSRWMRGEALRLMRRHVTSLAAEGLGDVGFEAAAAALRRAYGGALGLAPRAGGLTAAEEAAIARWERRFADPEWLAGPPCPRAPGRRVKICAGVWVYGAGADGLRVEASFVDRRIAAARVEATALNGGGPAMAAALVGAAAAAPELERRLVLWGETGRRVTALLAGGLRPA